MPVRGVPASPRIACVVAVAFAVLLAVGGPAHAATAYTYDSLGRLVRVDYGAGSYITYRYDAAGNRSAVGNATTNAAPVAVNDAVTLNQNGSATFDPRSNDSDPDYDVLTITAKTDGTHGTVAINAGTSLTYTPATGFHGSDSFTYTVSDGAGHTAGATVAATVVNRPPVAVDDSISALGGAAATFDPRVNDSDPEGDTLTITAKTDGAYGTVAINGGTSLTYTPVTGYAGSDSFTYTISDGNGHTATATVAATVTAANQAPVAVNDTVSFIRNLSAGQTVRPIVTFDPRVNDSDPDGDTLTITAVTSTANATVSIGGGGTSVTYSYNTMVSNLITTETFTYTISDGHGHTATANVAVQIDVERGGDN